MSGKSKTRRLHTRRFRRAFKAGADLGAKVSGNKINRFQYGTGIGRSNCKNVDLTES